jgi:hypothetical protein
MMPGWDWLTKFAYSWRFAVRVMLKAGVLFALANVVFALIEPVPLIGRVTMYNGIVPGRERLPYGENPASYNLSLNSVETMFASHVISTPKQANEFRVLVMGDSSVWGILLENDQTLAGYLTDAGIEIDGRTVRAYNLGHPIMSVTKDLMLLDYVLRYRPDMIVWMVTLESLPVSEQLEPPLLANNAARVRSLIERYGLALNADDERLIEPNFWERTLIGQRRAVADWLRLQAFGFAWAATGIDQVYGEYTPRSNDFDADASWKTFSEETTLPADALALDVLAAGHAIVGDVPLIIVNEPIYIADGENSDIRYNFWYPRWAYDQYRALLQSEAEDQGWRYVDLWDAIASSEFTDSPVHLRPEGSQRLSELVTEAVFN